VEEAIAVLLVVVVLALVVWAVGSPLRASTLARIDERLAGEVADLEARRDSKYREIREAELDFRTGKLAEADWRELDRELRAEAVAILRELDRLGEA
jgi:hypothetical protein